jgi:two-component system, OmpR family, alkaline phosphatase synthesis response regulator PhoP
MAKKIYVVDDEENILEIICHNLTKSGYEVRGFKDGRSFLEYFKIKIPDLVILDLMLPDIDGFDICKDIKEKTDVPVIILSARSEEFDRVLGLELGADDYVVKPFGVRELVARVKNILKRVKNASITGSLKPLKSSYTFKSISLNIDEDRHELFLDNNNIKLNPKEFEVMVMLLRNINDLVIRKELIKKIWGEDYFGDTRTLDVHIRRIREKLSYRDFGKDYLKTIHGYGYKITNEI